MTANKKKKPPRASQAATSSVMARRYTTGLSMAAPSSKYSCGSVLF